jgi:hypothetical protein
MTLRPGPDPTIGLLHAGRVGRGRHDFVRRTCRCGGFADRKVLEFVQAHTFHPADLTVRSDGVCRLNPEMARKVVGLFTSDFATDTELYRSHFLERSVRKGQRAAGRQPAAFASSPVQNQRLPGPRISIRA